MKKAAVIILCICVVTVIGYFASQSTRPRESQDKAHKLPEKKQTRAVGSYDESDSPEAGSVELQPGDVVREDDP